MAPGDGPWGTMVTVDGAERRRRWVVDGNNVFGSRPDGWWNDRGAAMARFTQAVAEWCRTHRDDVIVVFDPPVPAAVVALGGGNLRVEAAPRHGRDAADHRIAELVAAAATPGSGAITVVTGDRGLQQRLAGAATIESPTRFRTRIGY